MSNQWSVFSGKWQVAGGNRRFETYAVFYENVFGLVGSTVGMKGAGNQFAGNLKCYAQLLTSSSSANIAIMGCKERDENRFFGAIACPAPFIPTQVCNIGREKWLIL
ncbi:MAG: hypothetical protein ACI9EW_000328 [Cellvibrionaceae bacterium]|jgi:hypothetical protein